MTDHEDNENYYDEDEMSPCEDCDYPCDGWEAMFCCRLCHFLCTEDCENCDPMDL